MPELQQWASASKLDDLVKKFGINYYFFREYLFNLNILTIIFLITLFYFFVFLTVNIIIILDNHFL